MIDNIWNILLIAALIAGLILFFVYPYQPQSEKVLKQYFKDKEAGVIIVIYQTDSKEEAIELFSQEYPSYRILEVYKGRHGVYIRAVKE